MLGTYYICYVNLRSDKSSLQNSIKYAWIGKKVYLCNLELPSD